MTETFEQMALRTWQEVCKSLSVGAPVAIKFAAAIRDELAKGAEPVAWMNSRNGFIAKENKNPEYNVGLYPCPPASAARIAKLEQERDELRQQLAASQAREQQFREMLKQSGMMVDAFFPPGDTTALQSMIAKAGDVALKRAIAAASAINPIYGSGAAIDAISTVRIVTLDDLKDGYA